MRYKLLHIVLLVLLLGGCIPQDDWIFSADKNSTKPFGLFLAYDRLEDIYPVAKKSTIYKLQEEIESYSGSYYYNKRRLLVAVTANLYLSSDEALNLYNYVNEGGKILMLSQYFSPTIDSVFEIQSKNGAYINTELELDSTNHYQINWDENFYDYNFKYPFSKSFFEHGEEWQVIGYREVDSVMKPNLLKRKIGEGEIILGNAPEMITNYAMLQDTNVAYYEKLFSHFSKRTTKLQWFSKHTVYPKRDKRSKSNFWKLLQEPSYRNAFLVILLLAILFLIFETRRRQRIVPVVPPVTNDSLAFTELIGKLYYGEKDHKNLSQKMIRYYLEHIRTAYNIPTTHLNKEMAHKLARKLSKPEEDVQKFIDYLNTQLTAYQLSEAQIKQLYKTLKKYS